ncbi:MAG: methionine gamma-lyase family protein [Clostridia bacterium]|nr:methionine gamma-lyase family protein [Clostridia bacterium]
MDILDELAIDGNLRALAEQAEVDLAPYFKKAEEVCAENSKKVLKAFIDNRVAYQDFEEINGYGFFDPSRDKIERVFAQALGAEDALVRPHIMSGTNAIWLTLSGLLHPGDTLVSITGTPYDPLCNIVGITGNSKQSLKNNGVKYEQIELLPDGNFDTQKITDRIKKGGVSMVEIQRSRGYSHREGISVSQIGEITKAIKAIDKNVIVMVDNCYGEMVEKLEPTDVGADIMAGSLMHNLGGGIATSGGYIAGKEKYVAEVAERLTAPCIGKDLGANYNQSIKFLKGLYLSPQTVLNAVKSAMFLSYMLNKLGYKNISPKFDQIRTDIVQTFDSGSEEALTKFCQGLQKASPIDSFVTPIPSEFPGYPHEEVMAAGTFTQGSTIEITCDAPVIAPYTAYMQGGISYEYSKIALLSAISNMRR